jgi:hypothetical protein
MTTSLEKQEDDSIVTLKMEKQNSTLETTNQPFVSRTYEESPYARRQWEYWTREQRLKRMDEFESVIYGGTREFDELDEATPELLKNRHKMEPEEFQKQFVALEKETTHWDDIACKRVSRVLQAGRGFERRIKELLAFSTFGGVWYRDGEQEQSLLFWLFDLVFEKVSTYEINRFFGSVWKEWLRDYRQLEQNWLFDRNKQKELQRELKDLELPRIVSKRNKGLKWPLNDDQVDMFNKVAEKSRVFQCKRVRCLRISMDEEGATEQVEYEPPVPFKLKKMVTTMHPFVDNKLRDTLVVGDYMRVSTNQSIKHKFTTRHPSWGDLTWEDCLDSLDGPQHGAWKWAKHVREHHPEYRDPETRAEKNAKRIEAIKKAYPDYF